MAVLIDADRQDTYVKAMQVISDERQSCAVTKAQLRAAVDAIDDWADSNATAFNNALPAAAKANLTAAQKALLFAWILLKRAGRL